MSATKVVLNLAGFAALRKSAPVKADLEARANRIADAAGEGMVVVTSVGKTRARAAVITGDALAMVAEATNRDLTSAVDAGR